MANPPGETEKLAFIIKRYEGGAFSGQLDGSGAGSGGGLSVGSRVELRGPYGTCFRREKHEGPLILVGGGSGMSPLWSIFQDHVESGEQRSVRFFYGARSRADLFYLDEIKGLGAKLADFEFIPVLSDAADDDDWSGEKGMVHEVLQKHLADLDLSDGGDAYTCGPPPMIDAVLPMLIMSDIEGDRIFFDKFTQASG